MCSVKQQLKELVEAVGFENWHESRIAELLLYDDSSYVELNDDRWLVMGYYESDFVYVRIDLVDGHQLIVHRAERRS